MCGSHLNYTRAHTSTTSLISSSLFCLTFFCFTFSANSSPNITVDKVFNVTEGQQNKLTLTTFDKDGDTVNVTFDSSLPVGATFVGNVYTWTPSNMEPVNISCVLPVLLYFKCAHIIIELDIH